MTENQVNLVVIDDDEEIATLIKSLAEQAGYSVKTIIDSKLIHHDRAVHDAAVIVLDLQMPELDGIQVLRVLADEEVKAGIVLVSGMDDRTRSSAERYGNERGLRVLGTLEKPFSPEDLVETLKSAFALSTPLTRRDLERAINEDQLFVVYQPTVARNGREAWKINSVEALLRWEHPDRGLLGPAEFITMGESSGLIQQMTDFVLQRGIEQLKGWQCSQVNLGLRVNLSAALLTDVEFPDRLEALIAELGVDPSALTLEITETAMLDEHPKTIDILTRFRLKQINLAIDDFGIGYSSLTQLFRMPFNEMKIDKSLLLHIPESKEAIVMVQALVELAHNLGLTVCAEGVESREALEFLETIGCDCAQGYFIGRPVASKDISVLIRDGNVQGEESHAAVEFSGNR